MNFLLSVTQPTAPWEWLILSVLDFIGNYGLRVIFLIVMLKLILFPIDFFQRKTTVDNARKMERMKPKMEELQVQFAHDKSMLAQKQRELQKKEKYNPFIACLPMILTLVIFITLFNGFRICMAYYNAEMVENMHNTYSQYTTVDTENGRDKISLTLDELQEYCDKIKQQDITAGSVLEDDKYIALESELFCGMNEEAEGRGRIAAAKKLAGQEAVLELYEKKYNPLMNFGIVSNVWQPDTFSNPIPDADKIKESLNNKNIKNVQNKSEILSKYDDYIKLVKNKYNKGWNGYFVFVALSIGLNFLQQFITQRQQKKANPSGDIAGSNSTMKMMMFIMPVMMGVFAFTQPASFAIYMVTNASMGILSNLSSSLILKVHEKHKEKKQVEEIQSTGVRSVRGMKKK